MILVTGGAGYIGSHTCIALAQAGLPFVILDNFSNSRQSVLRRIGRITGAEVPCVQGDIRDEKLLRRLLREYPIEAVIHFAALKSVAESVGSPLAYYDNNVTGTLRLMQAMDEAGVRTLVFSSSATVYGDPVSVPVREDAPLSPTNPYGWTKLVIEQAMADLCAARPQVWRMARLRYFNPVGAHPSGAIGESPEGVPNNLMPYLTQVAIGQRPDLKVFGNDYPTVDGSGVRDYIHVCDLAAGHVAALRYLAGEPGLLTVNLGTGRPASVLQLVREFERASGRRVPIEIIGRRPGDVAEVWADPSKAARLLGWTAERSLAQMCADSWRWQQAAGMDEPVPLPAAFRPDAH